MHEIGDYESLKITWFRQYCTMLSHKGVQVKMGTRSVHISKSQRVKTHRKNDYFWMVGS